MAHKEDNSAESAFQFHIVNTTISYLPDLADLQYVIYPTLTIDERYTVSKYRRHIELFPDGQFVALASFNGNETVVGATSSFRIHFDFGHVQHSFKEISADGWLTNHDPQGEWLYGAGLEVHPDYRRIGIGGRLYAARRVLVRRLNLCGEITGGMLPGYKEYRHLMTVEQFVWHVAHGKAYCPTLSMQLKMGFRVIGVLYDHLTDPDAENCCSLIVRHNPDYVPENLVPMGKRISPNTRLAMVDALGHS